MPDHPRVTRFADQDKLATAAAEAFVRDARQAIAERGRFAVALSGGGTPRQLHAKLAASPFREQLAWNRVRFFWGDERCVPPDHPESNFRMAKETLLEPLGIEASQAVRMPAERPDLAAAAADYATAIVDAVADGDRAHPPAFDLILLGLGDDSHTASLFPDTAALAVVDQWVAANEVPQLNTRRMTFTYPLLNAARCVRFLVAGAGKAAALKRVLQGPRDPRRWPAQGVHPTPGRLEWFVDEAAATELSVK